MNAPEVKPLTQEELLAEAAKTELENQRSLQVGQCMADPRGNNIQGGGVHGPHLRGC